MNLFKHQEEGLQKIMFHKRFAFFWDTGTGKTILGLSIIKSLHKKALIVAPKALLSDAWVGDARRFGFEVPVNYHDIKNKKNKEELIFNARSLVINYESLQGFPELLSSYNFKLLILDESQKIKSPSTKITKLIVKNHHYFDNIYLLSATPAPNTELEYWAQLYILMPDIVERSFYRWRMHWFIPQDRYGWKWKLNSHKKEEFLELLSEKSMVVEKNEVLKDLQGQHFRVIHYSLSSQEKRAYKEMSKNLLLEIDQSHITAQSAVVKMMKLRQILSGFILEEGKVHYIGQSKLKSLAFLLSILKEQAVIWIQFREEAEQLRQFMEENGFKYGVITAQTSSKERDKILNGFRKGEIDYIVAHPRTIGHGITLVNTNVSIYYSLPYSYEEYKQSQDRIYRHGQQKPVYYYILLSEDKLLDNIVYYNILQQKKEKIEVIFDLIKQMY